MAEQQDTKPPAGDPPAPRRAGAGGALQRKVGPLSVAGWLAVGVAGVGLGLFIKRRGFFAAGPAPANLPEGEVEIVDAGNPGYTPVGAYAGVGNQPVVTGPPGAEGPTTNDQWVRVAIEQLLAQEAISPGTSQPALQRFIEGLPVTPQQAAIVAMAMRLVGPPPEGAPAMVVEEPSQTEELTSLSNAELLASGQATLDRGGNTQPFITEALRRMEAGNLSVNHVGSPSLPFGVQIVRAAVGRWPERVPTPENIAARNPTALDLAPIAETARHGTSSADAVTGRAGVDQPLGPPLRQT